MTADYPDWLPPAQQMLQAYFGVTQQLAALIATGSPNGLPGGVPLLHGFNTLSTGTINLAANGAQTLFLPTRDPGYQIELFSRYHAANGALPFVQVELLWVDSATNQIMGAEHWTTPVTALGGFVLTTGRGPVKAGQLNITFTNVDPAQPVDVFYEIQEMTQYAARDDWRSGTPNGVPGYTAMPGDPLGLVIGAVSPTIPGNNLVTYLLPLFTGQVQVNIIAPAAVNFSVQAALAAGFFGMSSTQLLSNLNTPQFVLNLPRHPVQLTIQNQNAAPQLFIVSVLPIEFAS